MIPPVLPSLLRPLLSLALVASTAIGLWAESVRFGPLKEIVVSRQTVLSLTGGDYQGGDAVLTSTSGGQGHYLDRDSQPGVSFTIVPHLTLPGGSEPTVRCSTPFVPRPPGKSGFRSHPTGLVGRVC